MSRKNAKVQTRTYRKIGCWVLAGGGIVTVMVALLHFTWPSLLAEQGYLGELDAPRRAFIDLLGIA